MARHFPHLIPASARQQPASRPLIAVARTARTPARPLMLVLLLGLIGLALTACGSDKKDSAKEGLSVGDTAPAFSLPASDGSTVSLAAYKGQPVLLFFHMAEG